ncbi:MAG: R3H domain-containing nucleic acid-binding protein [Patescibacteria group bacterium]|nr:KH domain-containing protein [Patescibacteria group bacterium]
MKDKDLIKKAEEIVSKVLKALEPEASAKVTIETDEDEKKFIKVVVEGENLGFLIGYRGGTLNALQMIFSQIISNQAGEHISVLLDINNYRERRDDYLKSLAGRAVEEVKENSQKVALPPLTAFERRIIHLTLQDDKDVRTESEGEGSDRHIVIFPKKE